MGEYSNLYIGDYNVDSWKNCIGSEGAILFTPEDLTRTTQRYRGFDEEDYDNEQSGEIKEQDEVDQEDEQLRGFQYRSTAKEVIDRLEIMGYTLDRAKEHFEIGIADALQDIEDLEIRWKEWGKAGMFDGVEVVTRPDPFESYKGAVKFYEGYTFEVWSGLIKEIFEKKIKRIYSSSPSEERSLIQEQTPYLYHVLNYRVPFSFDNPQEFGFPGYDPDYMYRGMLEVVDPDTPVILDFSILVGWVGQERYTCGPPRTVILTEGVSDKRILEAGLRFLYPHLYHYYDFVDFDLANLPGSAGNLLNTVRALIVTGVERRTVAIFDNDAAGHDAIRQLANVTLPDNIKVMVLPSLDIASSYPTVGPQGQIKVDINGKACSIELYLGRDILQDAAGELTPVRWGNWIQGVQRHQGEIQNKLVIQEKYFQLLSEAVSNPERMKEHDWGGMRLILQHIFDLFKNQPPVDEFTGGYL